MAKSSIQRLALDVINWDNWDASLEEIQKRETSFCQVYDIWKDTRDQEICEAVYQQHREGLEAIESSSCNVIALQKTIKDKQKEASRIALLDWLSFIDPSENYNSAIQP